MTLEGEVEWQYQKQAAERAVRYLTGVAGVIHSIVVKPRISPSGAEAKSRRRSREPELDARRVAVEVREAGDAARASSTLRLKRRKRRDARRSAAPGGSATVENLLTISSRQNRRQIRPERSGRRRARRVMVRGQGRSGPRPRDGEFASVHLLPASFKL